MSRGRLCIYRKLNTFILCNSIENGNRISTYPRRSSLTI
nr:MAG TPA: hypothetical protein [Caudoviricetes sp.]